VAVHVKLENQLGSLLPSTALSDTAPGYVELCQVVFFSAKFVFGTLGCTTLVDPEPAAVPYTSNSQIVKYSCGDRTTTYRAGANPAAQLTAINCPAVATAGPRPQIVTELTVGGVTFGAVLVRPMTRLFSRSGQQSALLVSSMPATLYAWPRSTAHHGFGFPPFVAVHVKLENQLGSLFPSTALSDTAPGYVELCQVGFLSAKFGNPEPRSTVDVIIATVSFGVIDAAC
jgi:hypothetical protein